MSSTAKRTAYFDNVKFFLITLVVIGHTISPLAPDSAILMASWKCIYTFHMPVFIFLNGYFSSLKKNRKEKCLHFILLYIGMQCLSTICLLIFRYNHLSFSLLSPRFGLWYLIGLFVWTFLLPVTRYIHPFVLLPASIILSLLAGYQSQISDFLSLSRILFFFPFFLSGFYMREKMDFMKILQYFSHPFWKLTAIIILAILFILTFRFGSYVPQGLYLAKYGYSHKLMSFAVPAWLCRLGLYGTAFLTGSAFLVLIPRLTYWFSVLGQRTLAVYLGHILVLDLVKDRIPYITRFITIPGIVLIAFAITLLFSQSIFSFPINRLMKTDFSSLSSHSRISTLRPAPFTKKLRHWRHFFHRQYRHI